MNPIELIQAERRRQLSLGWTPDHDDLFHGNGDLARAAACYALEPDDRAFVVTTEGGRTGTVGNLLWPFPLNDHTPPQGPKPQPSRVIELVKAGALIVAEIERLQRAEQKGGR